MENIEFVQLLDRVRACDLCRQHLPLAPHPIVQLDPQARILVAGQAPGIRAHEAGWPFADASGRRLRDWMGINETVFYNPRQVAILPMGFCYPGRGRSGDLPPRPECAPAWRTKLMAALPNLAMTLVIGRYAMDWHLPATRGSLTETVRQGWDPQSGLFPLPHPSPRNNGWLKRNPWFEADCLPVLNQAVKQALSAAT